MPFPPPPTCIECDAEIEEEEPSGLCYYTGNPHSYSNDPSTTGCDCGAKAKVLCDDCEELEAADAEA